MSLLLQGDPEHHPKFSNPGGLTDRLTDVTSFYICIITRINKSQTKMQPVLEAVAYVGLLETLLSFSVETERRQCTCPSGPASLFLSHIEQ